MSATTRPRKSAYVIVETTQHWRLIRGRWYRDCVVLVDGQRRLWGIPDEVAA